MYKNLARKKIPRIIAEDFLWLFQTVLLILNRQRRRNIQSKQRNQGATHSQSGPYFSAYLVCCNQLKEYIYGPNKGT